MYMLGGGNVTNADVRILLFKADWCPYCQQFDRTGIYDQVKKTMAAKYPNISFETRSDKDVDQMRQLGVSGFPTIVAVNRQGHLIEEFKGDRNNPVHLYTFAQNALKKI